jgi:hypothetical protein
MSTASIVTGVMATLPAIIRARVQALQPVSPSVTPAPLPRGMSVSTAMLAVDSSDASPGVAAPVVDSTGAQVTAITLGESIASGGASTVGTSYALQTYMPFMLQGMGAVDYYNANNRTNMCNNTWTDGSDGADVDDGGVRTYDACILASNGAIQDYTNNSDASNVFELPGQGWGQLGPCAVNATNPANSSLVNSAMIVSWEPMSGSASPQQYALRVHLTGDEQYATARLGQDAQFVADQARVPAVPYYLSISLRDVNVPLYGGGAGKTWLWEGGDAQLQVLTPSTTPTAWTIEPNTAAGSFRYKLSNSGQTLDTYWTDSYSGVSNGHDLCTAQANTDSTTGELMPGGWRMVLAEAVSASQCLRVTQTGCPGAPPCVVASTAAGAVICPACCFSDTCATSPSTAVASSMPPGWSLCRKSDPFQVEETLTHMCGQQGASSGPCINGLSTCTRFSQDSTSGVICRTYCGMNPKACDAAYGTACGVDSASSEGNLSEVLQTPECSCVNVSKSTAKYTGLKLDYPDFAAFLTKQGAPPLEPNAQCWWPACTGVGAQVGALVPSNISGCPSSMAACVIAIGNVDPTKSNSVINAGNSCGTTAAGPATTSSQKPSNDPDDGSSKSTSSTSAPPRPWYKQTWFYIVLAVVILVIIIVIISVAVSSKSREQPANGTQYRGMMMPGMTMQGTPGMTMQGMPGMTMQGMPGMTMQGMPMTTALPTVR